LDHFKSRTIIYLAFFICIVITIIITTPKSVENSDGKLTNFTLEDLKRVAYIRISRNSEIVDVKKVGDTWILPKYYNYPVDTGTLSIFLEALVNQQAIRVIDADSADLDSLKLRESGKSAGVKVELIDTDDKIVSWVILGARHFVTQKDSQGNRRIPNGRYVLAMGRDKPALVNHTWSYVRPKLLNWLERVFFHPGDILEITNCTKGWKLRRSGFNKDYFLVDDDKKVAINKQANEFFAKVLNQPNFKDVHPIDSDIAKQLMRQPDVIVLKGKSDISFTLKIGSLVDECYCVSIIVCYERPNPPTRAANESNESFDHRVGKYKYTQKYIDKLLANYKRFTDWVYLIPAQEVHALKAPYHALPAPPPRPEK
jgi:hypothetical protein